MRVIMPDNDLEDLYKLVLRLTLEYNITDGIYVNYGMTDQTEGVQYAVEVIFLGPANQINVRLSVRSFDNAYNSVHLKDLVYQLGYDYRYDPFTDVLSVYYRDTK